jgi:hypothetical protein
MYGAINLEDIQRIRDRLDILEDTVASISAIPRCEIALINDLQFDRALLVVAVKFNETPMEAMNGEGGSDEKESD